MEETQQILDLIYKPNLVGSSRQLVISEDYIQLNAVGRNTSIKRFEKHEIVSYRFGVKWLKGFEFTIGREYQVFIKNSADKVLKISFKSLYGYKKSELNHHFNTILQSLWRSYFYDLVNDFLEQISKGETVQICGVQISDKYVLIKTQNLLKANQYSIPWEYLGSKDYATYFAIYSTENPTDINCGYSYLDDWDVAMLYSVVETLKKQYSDNSGK